MAFGVVGWRVAGRGEAFAQGGRVRIGGAVERDGGMAPAPTGEIAGEVAGDGKQPSRKLRVRPVTVTAFIDPHEGLLREIEGVAGVSRVAEDEGHQRRLPTAHQFIQREIVAGFEPSHALDIVRR